MSTISQGKVTTLMQTLNKIEQRIKKLHSLIRFVLEKILEKHFYMPSTCQYSRNVLLSFIKKQLKLANLVLKHRIGYLTKAHHKTFLSCTAKSDQSQLNIKRELDNTHRLENLNG